jgi:hypothetical protein
LHVLGFVVSPSFLFCFMSFFQNYEYFLI